MEIREHVALKPFTTLNVGGPARFFADVHTVDDLHEVAERARREREELLIIGGGSNVLIADEGFSGYVVRVMIGGVEFNDLENGNVELIAGAGENWDAIVELAVHNKLWGIENLTDIPGSVGAAPVQNIGAYGVEFKDVAQWVEVCDTHTGTTRKLMPMQCRFGYRDSIFKHRAGRHFVVTRVCMLLSRNGKPHVSYKDISAAVYMLPVPPTLDDMRRLVRAIRAQKFPHSKQYGTAGSFFKNPVISRVRYALLKMSYPDMPHFSIDWWRVKVPAAWILDTVCGLKGASVGNVGLFKNQPLVLVTKRGACARDVKKLADTVQRTVYIKTKIWLEPEVRFIGFENE